MHIINFKQQNSMHERKITNVHKENLLHFLGVCPILRECRQTIVSSEQLAEEDMLDILDGRNAQDWIRLIKFLKPALKYKNFL